MTTSARRTVTAPRPVPIWQRALPWVVTLACFAYLYFQIERQAARQGQSAISLLASVFSSVPWLSWLALMIPYSAFFFLVDSLVVWRVVNWFNARVPLRDILPVRASTYILSILNEQVGKGAMALYLQRREGVPGWSSQILITLVASGVQFILLGILGGYLGSISREVKRRPRYVVADRTGLEDSETR